MDDLARRVGPRAARRLVAFAHKVRATSPLPVIEIVLFGSRARGDASHGSDWDVAIILREDVGTDTRKTRRSALNLFSDIALTDIAAGFHLRPIVIPATEAYPDRPVWKISPTLARNVRTDGLLIT